jgi:hypothetical protein
MRKHGTRKNRRGTRGTKKTHRRTQKQRSQRSHRRQKSIRKHYGQRGGCGGSVCMTGGEDPQLSTNIHNYVMSDLPHRITG